ncbi:uncharacterized protein LOC113859577 [Abrus precatorius]|uniref:Uncharacterized protein LOC113859577 n=1 Tax=Abrus precatorius TaxID=3816 RepID=A0A8B8KXN2_ABRPR|nr:uncharacterized protein LOC113859577 [Abrus precatorius]
MGCHEKNKVAYAAYLLCGEAKDWWRFVGQTLPQEDGYIQWEMFKTIFLGNYFSWDLRKQKAREFLELKQGSMTVGEYAEDLCAQFEHRLRSNIRAAFHTMDGRQLPPPHGCNVCGHESLDKGIGQKSSQEKSVRPVVHSRSLIDTYVVEGPMIDEDLIYLINFNQDNEKLVAMVKRETKEDVEAKKDA